MEIAIAIGVLAVTALLVNAVPAKQAASEPFTRTFNTLGVQVNAIVDPARAGTLNQFHFYVLGSGGEPRAIPELDATVSLPSQGIGPLTVPLVVAGPGHYIAVGVRHPLRRELGPQRHRENDRVRRAAVVGAPARSLR